MRSIQKVLLHLILFPTIQCTWLDQNLTTSTIFSISYASVFLIVSIQQGCPTLLLAIDCPAKFSSISNQTHPSLIFKRSWRTLAASGVWLELELNFAGQSIARSRVVHPSFSINCKVLFKSLSSFLAIFCLATWVKLLKSNPQIGLHFIIHNFWGEKA